VLKFRILSWNILDQLVIVSY